MQQEGGVQSAPSKRSRLLYSLLVALRANDNQVETLARGPNVTSTRSLRHPCPALRACWVLAME